MVLGVLLLSVAVRPSVAEHGQVFKPPQGVVENVRFEQAQGGVINITYDLKSDDANAVFSVALEVSQDGGKSFNVKATSVSGDIGAGVRPGFTKRIVWAASRDVENLQVDQFRFNIRASAGAVRPVTTGRITVNSTPPGATVFLDGTSRGVTPLALADVTAGSHEVRLAREGFLEHRRNLEVKAGASETVDVALTAAPAPAAQPPPSQPTAPPQSGGGGVNKMVWVGVAAGGAAAAALALGGGDTVEPPPQAQACTFTLSAAPGEFPRAGGTATVTVTANPAGCSPSSWTATSSDPSWVTVNPSSGSGSGTVTLTAAANNGGSRSASITIAGQSFNVGQQAAQVNCTFALSSAPGQFPSNGGTATVTITVGPAGCSPSTWTASSGVSWITINPTSGNGSGTVTLTAAANTATSSRSGTVTIAGQNVNVSQAGTTACTIRADFGADGDPRGTTRTSVPGNTTGARRQITVEASSSSCEWSIHSLPPWLAWTEGSGRGSGTAVVVTTQPNTTGADRTGTFRLNDITFTVIQCAASC
jgi:hypothetical protein